MKGTLACFLLLSGPEKGVSILSVYIWKSHRISALSFSTTFGGVTHFDLGVSGVLCLLHPGTAGASVLDTTGVYYYDYDYTADYLDFPTAKSSETNSTEILPTKQPDFSGVFLTFRLILVCAISILLIFPAICFAFLWKKRFFSAGRASGERCV
ncbi:uncharacterized protein LOC144994028 isoform X1 [Oryzias latipes]